MFDLTFPSEQVFPLYPTRPELEDDPAFSAFLDALNDFFQHLFSQNASTRSYFQAAGVYFNDTNQESALRTQSADVTEQAIAAVIKNIAHPTRREYVWSAEENRWVLVLLPK
jgi:hypothetical protein